MSEKNKDPQSRINPTKGTPESSHGQKVKNVDPVEHRVHPVENGADPEEARKADVDKYKQ
jgi:hypothetical protein